VDVLPFASLDWTKYSYVEPMVPLNDIECEVTMELLVYVPQQVKITALSEGTSVVHEIVNLPPLPFFEVTFVMVGPVPPPPPQRFASTPTGCVNAPFNLGGIIVLMSNIYKEFGKDCQLYLRDNLRH